jgi:hypothetical protein
MGCTYFHLYRESNAWKVVMIVTKEGMYIPSLVLKTPMPGSW